MPTGIYKRTEYHKNSISKGMLGHFVSEETKKKLSLSKIGDRNPNYGKTPSEKQKRALNRKGIPLSEEHKLKIGEANKGIKRSEETKRKLSKAKKGKYGKDTNNWKNGITPKNILIRTSIEYRLWREAIFARDNWTCQNCGKRGVKLNAHHIKSFAQYPELRFAIDNGITLCKKCHKKIGLHKGIKKNAKASMESVK